MSAVREYIGHELMIVDVSEEELRRYEDWLENETRWSGNMGYTRWPSDVEDRVMLVVSSGFGGTWFNEIVPALKAYWGESRIINEVEFAEGPPITEHGEGDKEKYKVLPATHLHAQWRELGPLLSNIGGRLIASPGTIKQKDLNVWNDEIKALCRRIQDLYNETFQHITRPRK